MTTRNGIPKAALALLEDRWKSDEYTRGKFAQHLEGHADGDRRSGLTSHYTYSKSRPHAFETFSYAELLPLLPVIPADLYRVDDNGIGLNQHYEHSLEQFLAEATHAWDEHVKRTEALIGTPAGRIWRAKP